MEERVAGQHAVAVLDEPVVEHALLRRGRVQVVPDVCTAARGAKPGQPQLGPVLVGDRLELVELSDVVAGAHDGELEVLHPCVRQVAHRTQGGLVRSWSANIVVDLGGRAVERDLHVEVVVGGEPSGDVRGDLDPVGRELHADVVGGRVVDDLPEVGAHGGLAAADVDVEDLHALEFVDDGLGLVRRQLARVPPAGTRETVHAREVAGVGEFPRQADRCVETVLEQIDQTAGRGPRRNRRSRRRGRGRDIQERHARRSTSIAERASVASAF